MFTRRCLRITQIILLIFAFALFSGLMLGYVEAVGTTPLLVKDINPNGDSSPALLTDVNGVLYFFADDGVHGSELWKSDGTVTGAMMLGNINPAGDSFTSPFSWLTNVNGDLYFSADDGVNGLELWTLGNPDQVLSDTVYLPLVGKGNRVK